MNTTDSSAETTVNMEEVRAVSEFESSVTTDLPEWRQDQGKHLAEYGGLTRDERTRGMGGLHASCGEENLLKLKDDRYRGRDICVHEFAHTIFDCGVADAVQLEARILGLREDVAEANAKLRKRLAALEHTVDSKPVKANEPCSWMYRLM